MKDHLQEKQKEMFWNLLLLLSPSHINYSLLFLLDIIDDLNKDLPASSLLFEKAIARLNWQVVQNNSQQLIGCMGRVVKYKIYLSDQCRESISHNLFVGLCRLDEWDLQHGYHIPILECMRHFFNDLPPIERRGLFQFLFSLLLLPKHSYQLKPVVSFILQYQHTFEKEELLEMGETWLSKINGREKKDALFFLVNLKPLIPAQLYARIIEQLLIPIINDDDCIYEECKALKPYIRYINFERKIALLTKFSLADYNNSVVKMKLFLDLYAGYRNDLACSYLQRVAMPKEIAEQIVYRPGFS